MKQRKTIILTPEGKLFYLPYNALVIVGCSLIFASLISLLTTDFVFLMLMILSTLCIVFSGLLWLFCYFASKPLYTVITEEVEK